MERRLPRSYTGFFVNQTGNSATGRIGHQVLVEPRDTPNAVLQQLLEQPEPVGLLNHAPMPPPSQARPYVELVEEGRSLVELGALRKVVLARSEDVHTDQPIDPWAVLNQLRHDIDPTSTAYLCDIPVGGTFIGLTPERLFSLRGKTLSTHALAGSRARGQTQAEDQALAEDLLACTKERKEHNLVVEHLQSHLRHRMDGPMQLPKTPSIRRLASVQHLETEIAGQLKNSDPWDLLAALHPTQRSAACQPAPPSALSTVTNTLTAACTPGPSVGYWAIKLKPSCPCAAELLLVARPVSMPGQASLIPPTLSRNGMKQI